jgi:hypothetical protein
MPRPRKKHAAKWDRCVRKVKRRRTALNAAAVCTAALAPRRLNPRQVALYAQARGTPVLKYIGGIKFARRGKPIKFDGTQHAMAVARQLKAQFQILRKFRLWAA